MHLYAQSLSLCVSPPHQFQGVVIHLYDDNRSITSYSVMKSLKWENNNNWGSVSFLVFLRWQNESSAPFSGILPTKSYSQKKKIKLTFRALQGRRLTAAITATPVGFYKWLTWLIFLQGIHKHPVHLDHDLSNKHRSHIFKNSISKFIFCQNIVMIKKSVQWLIIAFK